MSVPELIYCAGGNRRYAQIAIDAGMGYGAQLPSKTYFPLDFADQNWKKPNREKYMAALATHRPRMATVLDLESHEQLEDVMDWAEEAAQWVGETVIIIPKAMGIIPLIPETIGGRRVRLGYSVPTTYGGTELPLWEFGDRPVHLLGGWITAQLQLRRYLNVESADGNAWQIRAALMTHFDGKRWVKLGKSTGSNIDADDIPYTMFYLTCIHMMQAWRDWSGG